MKQYTKPITINGTDYAIKFVDKVTVDRKECFGCLIPKSISIEIEKDLARPVYIQTMLHEIIHAIELDYCMDFSEEDVDRLASGFASLFRHNPQFIKSLLEEK